MARTARFALVLIASVWLVALWRPAVGADVILAPEGSGSAGKEQLGLILLQGASIPAERYVPLGKAVQAFLSAHFAVWVGLPDFPLDLPMPVLGEVEKGIKRVEAKLVAAGMNTTKVFYGGHSLGAAVMQDLLNSNPNKAAGQVLMGATLLRKYREKRYAVPTLAVNGELDGMFTPIRVAEEFYYRILRDEDPERYLNFPVIIVEGSNHMQYAPGPPPSVVKKRDLKPEVSDEDALSSISAIIGTFMGIHSGSEVAPMSTYVASMLSATQGTRDFLQPLINALEMEGSYHLQKPCNSDTPNPHCPYYPAWPPQNKPRTPSQDDDCTCGCKWVEQVAVRHMANVPEDKYVVYDVDAFHDVTDTKPYHHSHLWSNCTEATQFPCLLNLTTVSQLIYDTFDDYDTGFTHVSAKEIRCKLKSRQAIYVASVNPNAKLEVTDAASICAEINQLAYEWALNNTGATTLERFQKIGQKMVMGEDILPIVSAGPLWIYNPLKYKEITNEHGEKVYEIRSPAMKTDLTAHLYPDSAGYHYCKLLSPARAMEWIYSDSLRRNGGISPGPSSLFSLPSLNAQ